MFKLIKKPLDILFPSHCISCSEIVSKDALFCTPCFSKLKFISAPKCRICSQPFDIELTYLPPICLKCATKKPHFDASFCLFRYEEIIAKALSALKYKDQSFLAKKLARILFQNFKEEIVNCDIICAVPLHKKKLQKRKFNQAVLLAQNFGKKFINDLLIRTLDSKAQVKLGQKQREENLKKAFKVNEKYQQALRGKKVLLIDDVMTTGATANSCAKALKKSGIKKVIILTVAKRVFE